MGGVIQMSCDVHAASSIQEAIATASRAAHFLSSTNTVYSVEYVKLHNPMPVTTVGTEHQHTLSGQTAYVHYAAAAERTMV